VTFAECPREQEVIDALTTMQWPERCGDELRAHVAACQGCTDIVGTVSTLSDAWTDARADAHVPASGMVWWRAQMRARREAARAAARPITVVQGIAGLAGLVLLASALAFLSPWVAASFAAALSMFSISLPDLRTTAGGWAVAGAIAFLAVTSMAVYFAVAED
jgi:hypothetical protein